MKTRSQYDEEFKKMTVELSDAKGSLKATAEELGITPQILTRWRRERAPSQALRAGSGTQGNREQQEILLLKKQLKQAELERDILKKAVGIFSRGDRAADRGKYSDL
ncbi:MAG: transposase [Bacteroidetes bacterium]|nr:transposase [Fibrella sp.]